MKTKFKCEKIVTNKKIKSEDIPTIIDMYFKKNKTIYEICNKFKVSRNTIENIISHYKYVNTEVS